MSDNLNGQRISALNLAPHESNGSGGGGRREYAKIEKIYLYYSRVAEAAKLMLDLLRADLREDNAPILAEALAIDHARRAKHAGGRPKKRHAAAAPFVSKIQRQREKGLAVLNLFDREEWRPMPEGMTPQQLLMYTRNGYLKRRGDKGKREYLRLAKEYKMVKSWSPRP